MEGERETGRGRGREEGMEGKEVRGRIPWLSTSLVFYKGRVYKKLSLKFPENLRTI